MKKISLFIFIALAISGCMKHENFESKDESQNKFALSDKINVNVTLPEGTRCLLFDAYPYSEQGDMIGEPVMVAYAPFNKQITVPKYVDKLYLYANGELREFANGDITLASLQGPVSVKSATSRADEEIPGSYTTISLTDAFVTAIYNFYPEAQENLTAEQRKICTDLVAPQGDILGPDGKPTGKQWEKAKVWITYVGNGGCNFAGDLSYYTYQVDANKNPITPFSELAPVEIFKRALPSNAKGKRVYLGEFEPGTRIGFIYTGNSAPRYSTPAYNKAAYPTNNYSGIASGVIRIWEYDGKEYATLGMENRLFKESGWDGDYNDFICLLEAEPLQVENTVDPPTKDPETIKWQGYWLFEDNYPNQGDYDFNDLVVKYKITEQPYETVIDLMFMARGASRNNSFGVNGSIYFDNLSGYMNVWAHQDRVEPRVEQIRVPKAAKYVPCINNGISTYDLYTYYDNNEDFPLILEIPVTTSHEFRWCLETVRIDHAYLRYKDWVNSRCTTDYDWYLDIPSAGTTWNK